jgi:hypothetical protein
MAIARAGRVSVVLVCWLSSATVAHAIGTTWTAQRELVAPNASLNGVLADPAGDTITAVDTSSATETRTLAGGTWGDAQALSSVVQPTLAVGPNGDKVLVWQSENSL